MASLVLHQKLFYFDSGLTTSSDVSDAQSFSTSPNDRDPQDNQLRLIPNQADFLLSYATVPGSIAYRHPEEGSRFIQHLVKALQHLHKR